MDMQNLLSYLQVKKEATEENTKSWDLLKNAHNKGVLSVLSEVIEDLEEISGLKAPIKPANHKVVAMPKEQRRMARS